MQSELRSLQQAFYQLVTAPTPLSPDSLDSPEALDWVDAISREQAVERLNIYAQMYFFRIKDVIAEDYDKTHALLGEAHFHNLITDYVLAHPPTEPSIRHVGARLAPFLRTHALSKDFPAAPDLADFEWTRLSVFDCTDPAPVPMAVLRALAPDAWGQLTLEFGPALQLRTYAYAVDEDLDFVRGNVSLAIWREGFVVYHQRLCPEETRMLEFMLAGATLSEATDSVFASTDVAQAATDSLAMLRRWFAHGWIAGYACG